MVINHKIAVAVLGDSSTKLYWYNDPEISWKWKLVHNNFSLTASHVCHIEPTG